jgi:nucleotide-binding universal stress UspA family protein
MKILLATDGSENANAALEFLLRFPFPRGSSVILLTVIDERAFVDTEAVELTAQQNTVLHEVRNTVREEAQAFLELAVQRLRERGWEATTQLRSGDVAEQIIVAADTSRVELVVVGSHGLSPVGRFLLGSVSTKVLDYAPCSVLIVRQSASGKPEPGTGDEPWRVLLAYDDSGPSRKALELCTGLPFGKRDEMEVITVLTLITTFRQDIRQHMSDIWQKKKIAAKAALDGAVVKLRGSMPNVTERLVEGDSSSHEIIKVATDAGSNLVVMGCKGKSAMQRLLVGSVTSHVARHAPCSVLVVRED